MKGPRRAHLIRASDDAVSCTAGGWQAERHLPSPRTLRTVSAPPSASAIRSATARPDPCPHANLCDLRGPATAERLEIRASGHGASLIPMPRSAGADRDVVGPPSARARVHARADASSARPSHISARSRSPDSRDTAPPPSGRRRPAADRKARRSRSTVDWAARISPAVPAGAASTISGTQAARAGRTAARRGSRRR